MKNQLLIMLFVVLNAQNGQAQFWAFTNSKWVYTNFNREVGIYGTKGIPDPENSPGKRIGAASCTDKNGVMWLFGGSDNENIYNDLWSFDNTNYQWTWQSGSNQPNESGVFGQIGVTSPQNVIGSRVGAMMWADNEGNLWIYGGYGSRSGLQLVGNDLWKYNIQNKTWTWINGSMDALFSTKKAVYGTMGVADAKNTPGSRYFAANFKDNNGNLWLFAGNNGNDLWKYNIQTGLWTWMKGNNAVETVGNYGQKGVEAATNLPDSRDRMIGMTDANGNFWVFGGTYFNDDVENYYLNDLWKFNVTTNNWTWISGTKTFNHTGVYGTLRIPSVNNVPRSRESACGWINKDGHLVLTGGQTTGGYLNDTWFYNFYTQEWVWQTGSNGLNDVGYINRTDPDEDNSTSARSIATTWEDQLGTLWMFGGFGPKLVYDSKGNVTGKVNNNRNDMNKIWVPGVDLKTTINNQSVILGTNQVQLITVNVSEQSKFGATRIKVRNIMPKGLTYLSRKTDVYNSGTIQVSNDTLDWTIASLKPQSNVTLQYFAQIDPTKQTGDLQLCSDVYFQYAYENNQANNIACTTVGGSLIQTELIGWGAQWKYFNEGKIPADDWYKSTYNDGSWKSGKAPLGYIDSAGVAKTAINGIFGTVLGYGSFASRYTTAYFRKTFNFNDSKVTDTNFPFVSYLNIKRDDGVVVYLNGEEIYRQNMPTGTISYTTNASQAVSFKTAYKSFIADMRNHTISTKINKDLKQGENLLAVEIHQCTANQDKTVDLYNDLIFDLELRSNHVNKSVPINAQTPSLNLLKGPYIQQLSPYSATIQWGTNLKSNSMGAIGTETGKPFNIINSGVNDNDTLHKVTFNNLLPNTRYYYSIGYNKRENVSAIDAGFLVLSGDANNYFITSPAPNLNNTSDSSQYTRFWAMGDMGTAVDLQFRVRNGYQKYLGKNALDGILLMGDNSKGFEDRTMGEGSDLLLKYLCFDVYRDIFKNTAIWPVVGNHDYLNDGFKDERYMGQNSAYFKNFSMPTNNETRSVGVKSNNKSYYSFDYGNAHFIMVDPYFGGTDRTVGGNLFFDTTSTSSQYKWLLNDLAAYNAVAANDTTPKWLIVIVHFPTYNVGNGHSAEEVIGKKVKMLCKDLLENSGVDLVLSGHEHSYQRTYFLKNDVIQQVGEKNSYYKTSKNDGTLYAVVGSSGSGVEKGDMTRPDKDKIAAWMFSNDSSLGEKNKGGSLDLRIFNTRLEGRFVDEDGVVRDSFFITKTLKSFAQINLIKGQSSYLTAAWNGKYKWSHDGNIVSKSTLVSPTQNTVYTISDPASGFSQKYTVNVNTTQSAHSLIPYGNYGWWSRVITPKSSPTESQWANADFDNMYSNSKIILPIYGQGNNDEQGKISLGGVSTGTKIMFKNYFYVNQNSNYSNYILSIFHEPRQVINLYINGVAFTQANSSSNTIANRKLTMFPIPSNLITQGQSNTVTIGMAIPASNYTIYPYSLTFDAELVGVVSGVVPPPTLKAFSVTTTATEPICANTAQADVSFITTNSPSNDINYVAMLSNGQNNEIVGANTMSPIRIQLPSDYDKNVDNYTVQVLPRQVAANLNGSKSLQNLQLPTGQLLGGKTIRYEETDTLTLNFTGSPPFTYNVINVGNGQTNEKLLKFVVSPNTTTEYTLKSVENTCGLGKSEGKANVTVLKPVLSVDQSSINQIWCNSFSRDITLNVINPPVKEHQYQVYLNSGSSGSLLVGKNNNLPIKIVIPDTISERKDYYLTAKYADISNQFYVAENSPSFPINRAAKGNLTSISGDSLGVLTGEKLQLKLNLEGTPPFKYVVKYGSQDTLSGETSLKQLIRSVTIPMSNIFELQSVNNVCGIGLVSGRVKVTLITSVDLPTDISIEVAPNPTENRLTLRLSLQRLSNINWEIVNSTGQKIISNSRTNIQNYVEQIDCSNLANGVYFLRVFVNGDAIVHKIVKY